MGVFDSYGKQGVQLKIGDPSLDHFKEGDEVNIVDGIYLGYEGAVVVIDGKLAKVFSYLKDKWGGRIRIRDVLNPINPINQALASLANKKDANLGTFCTFPGVPAGTSGVLLSEKKLPVKVKSKKKK